MPRVQKLPRYSIPGHCIMFAGRQSDERGFYLFENVIDGPNGDIQVGISGEGLRTIAARHGKEFGLALRKDLEQAIAEADDAEGQLAAANDRIAELEAFKEHLSGVAAEGFVIKKRTGRPAAQREESNA